MLTDEQIGGIVRLMALKKVTIMELSEEIEYNRGLVSNVINGVMSHPTVEELLLKWYDKNKIK